MSHMSFTEHRDLQSLRTFGPPTDNHALSQDGGFEQPRIAAFAQEAVVILGRQFNQYLQAETSTPKGVDGQQEKLQFSQYYERGKTND